MTPRQRKRAARRAYRRKPWGREPGDWRQRYCHGCGNRPHWRRLWAVSVELQHPGRAGRWGMRVLCPPCLVRDPILLSTLARYRRPAAS